MPAFFATILFEFTGSFTPAYNQLYAVAEGIVNVAESPSHIFKPTAFGGVATAAVVTDEVTIGVTG